MEEEDIGASSYISTCSHTQAIRTVIDDTEQCVAIYHSQQQPMLTLVITHYSSHHLNLYVYLI